MREMGMARECGSQAVGSALVAVRCEREQGRWLVGRRERSHIPIFIVYFIYSKGYQVVVRLFL